MIKVLQDQYIPQLGLDGLKKVSSEKYNCRCPICGDSKTNKRKRRGWFIWNRKFDTYVFNCFNCGETTNFQKICKLLRPSLFENYSTEEKKVKFNDFVYNSQSNKDISDVIHDDSIEVALLPKDTIKCSDNSKCLDYLRNRKVPERFIKKWKYNDKYGLIIPFEFDDTTIYGWQSRNLDTKYFHISLPEENMKIWNWFSVDKSKPVFICESIIDATMLYRIGEQSIAMLGADINLDSFMELDEPIFAFDNDKTGLDKTIKYSKLFPDALFLVYDKRIKQKDLNEIITSGIPDDKFKRFIRSHLKTGFQVQVMEKMKTL